VKVWIVSLVKRGFVQEPEILYDSARAERRKNQLLKDLNPDYDEIGIFEKEIRSL